MVFYKDDKIEITYERGMFVVEELAGDCSMSIPLYKDEVNQYLKNNGYEPVDMDKPQCKLVGEDGNIFNLMGIAAKTLKRCGMYEKAEQMVEKITKTAKSYDEALVILMEYVDVL